MKRSDPAKEERLFSCDKVVPYWVGFVTVLILLFFSLPCQATIHLLDNPTGGDCESASFGGIWNDVTKTCTMTQDFQTPDSPAIVFDSDGLTLNGWVSSTNKKAVIDTNTSTQEPIAVQVIGRKNITIKKLMMTTNFSVGIILEGTSDSIIEYNEVEYRNFNFWDGHWGIPIKLADSHRNRVQFNNLPQYNYIVLNKSEENLVHGNIANHVTVFGDLGVGGYNTISLNTLPTIKLFGASNNSIIDNSVKDSSSEGIFVFHSENNLIADNTIQGHYYDDTTPPPPDDLYIEFLGNEWVDVPLNWLYDLTEMLKDLVQSLTDFLNGGENIVAYGLKEESSANTVVRGNLFQSNEYAFRTTPTTIFYNNALIDNVNYTPFFHYNFSIDLPQGGNHWDPLFAATFPQYVCENVDGDDLCDNPFVYLSGKDNHPWATPWAWPDTAPPTVTSLLPQGVLQTDTTTISGDFIDPVVSIDDVEVMVNGTSLVCTFTPSHFSCPAAGLQHGLQTVTGKIWASAGAPVPFSFQFSTDLDQTPPTVSSTSPSWLYAETASLSATFNDAAPSSGIDADTAEVTLNGKTTPCTLTNSTTMSCSIEGLNDGHYAGLFRIADKAGNIGTGAVSFDVDRPWIIRDDATGGDCDAIGTWSPASKTCSLGGALTWTLSHAINGIEIQSSGITLEGNGRTLIGQGTKTGVLISNVDNVTLRRLTLDTFSNGILLINSSGSWLDQQTVKNNSTGLFLENCNNTTLEENSATLNSSRGMKLSNSQNTWLFDNDVSQNSSVGILLENSSSSNTLWRNDISGNTNGLIIQTGSGSNLIYNNNFSGNTGSQAFVLGSGLNNLFTMAGSMGNYWSTYHLPAQGCVDTTPADGICDSPYTSGTIGIVGLNDDLPLTTPVARGPFVLKNDATGGDCGLIGSWNNVSNVCTLTTDISLSESQPFGAIDIASSSLTLDGAGHSIYGCALSGCYGVKVFSKNQTSVTVKNLKTKGLWRGLWINGTSSSFFYNNSFIQNDTALYLEGTITDNTFYKNNFVDNNTEYTPASGLNSVNTIFSLSRTGGNFWSKYDEVVEGCRNKNNDQYCDNALSLSKITSSDFLPYTKLNGWENAPPVVSNVLPSGLVDKDYAVLSGEFSDPFPSSGIDIRSVQVLFNGTDVTGTCTISEAGFSCPVQDLGYGDHVIGGSVADKAGNIGVISGGFQTRVYRLRDNATGGDCSLIGTWNLASKTCTMTGNIAYGFTGTIIEIHDNNLTLDGANFMVSGSNINTGIYLDGRSGITIRNIKVQGLAIGIMARHSDSITLTNNELRDNAFYGLHLFYANQNDVRETDFINNNKGALLNGSSQNTFTLNRFTSNISSALFMDPISQDNKVWDNSFRFNGVSSQVTIINNISNRFTGDLSLGEGGNYWEDFDTPAEGCFDAVGDGYCDDPYLFTGGQDNRPVRGGYILQDDATGGDCTAIGQWNDATPGGTCVLSKDLIFSRWPTFGINIGASNITLDGNGKRIIGSGNTNGISTSYDSTTITDLKIEGFHNGFTVVVPAANTTITGVQSRNNVRGGYVLNANNTTVSENIFEENQEVGLLVLANNTSVYNNAFLANTLHASVGSTYSGNIFNLPAPDGGNYWDDFHTSAQGCLDTIPLGGDGFCDAPYTPAIGTIIGAQDNFPVTSLLSNKGFVLRDDLTGGDCVKIGNWNGTTKTCVLTTNIEFTNPSSQEGVALADQGIVFDGNGHVLSSGTSNLGTAVVTGLTGFHVIKNLHIEGFSLGIVLGGGNCELLDNTITGASDAAVFGSSLNANSKMRGNTINQAGIGIHLLQVDNTVIENNILSGMNTLGISLYTKGSNTVLRGNTISSAKGSAILVGANSSSSFSGLVIDNNTLTNNATGITLTQLDTSQVTDNKIEGNTVLGLKLVDTSSLTLSRNLFISNTVTVTNDTGSVFFQAQPIGGNYWSNYDSVGEGCSNTSPADDFCDTPYTIDGTVSPALVDGLPWTYPYDSDVYDFDNDGLVDAVDRCMSFADPDNNDTDGDNLGDPCDPDADGDGVVNEIDNCILVANRFQTDKNGDGYGDQCDPQYYCVDGNKVVSIQAAFDLAGSDDSHSVILLPIGEYYTEKNGAPFTYNYDDPFDLAIEGGYNADCSQWKNAPEGTIVFGTNAPGALNRAFVFDNQGTATYKRLRLTGLTARDGNATESHDPYTNKGGGIFASFFNGTLLFDNLRVFNNVADDNGGGISVATEFGLILMRNNVVTGNTTNIGVGGGVALQSGLFGHLDLTNNTLTGNGRAEVVGTDLALQMGGPQAKAELYNNIIWQDSAAGEISLFHNGSVVNAFYNDFGTKVNPTVLFDTAMGNISLDPWLGENPSLIGYHLPVKSGCLDKGINSAPYLPDTDMDGEKRINGRFLGQENVDIGADEYGFTARHVSLSWLLLLLGD